MRFVVFCGLLIAAMLAASKSHATIFYKFEATEFVGELPIPNATFSRVILGFADDAFDDGRASFRQAGGPRFVLDYYNVVEGTDVEYFAILGGGFLGGGISGCNNCVLGDYLELRLGMTRDEQDRLRGQLTLDAEYDDFFFQSIGTSTVWTVYRLSDSDACGGGETRCVWNGVWVKVNESSSLPLMAAGVLVAWYARRKFHGARISS